MTGRHINDPGQVADISGRLVAIEPGDPDPVYVVETTDGAIIRIQLPGLPPPTWPPPLERKAADPPTSPFMPI